ncbi:MAG: DUF1673 family protein [Candidatus Methanoperedens sp.]|nr:DUF1673 family protein [Candidatus Methanoperedens sp.]MCZ7395059.1 DUF1673 family protein [Candidatus Methanoperedens sp.]
MFSFEYVRKMMGWCPQEDFNLMHAMKGNCETVSVTPYKNDDFSEKGTKIVIDYRYLRFETIAIILFSVFFGLLILITAGFVFPEIGNLVPWLLVLLLLLASLVLLYQDRTHVIFTSNAIIIKRPVLHPIVISKDSILKTEVIKNINHTMRLIFLPPMILVQVFLIMDAVNTVSRYIAQNDPLAVIISFVLLEVTTMILFVVFFYKAYIRSYYPDALKVTAQNNKEITLYVDNPQDMENKLAGVK